MINRNQKTEAAKDEYKYSAEVVRAHKFGDERIVFDLRVNGVTIYGMRYVEYTTKEGNKDSMLAFPSRKDEKTGKYWSHAWFPVSDELKNDVESQLEAMLA